MTDTPPSALIRAQRLVNEIFVYMHSPVENTENINDRFRPFIRKDEFYISEHIRNATACWRLFATLDRIRDITFILDSYALKAKPEAPACTEEYIQTCRAHSLPFLAERLINAQLNFLAYFFDLECKDDKLDSFELVNFIHLFNENLSNKIITFIKNESAQYMHSTYQETYYDYCGLPKITVHEMKDEKFNTTVKAIRPYPVEEVIRNSQNLIETVIQFLEFLKDELKNKYPLGAYTSSNDCVIHAPDPESPFKEARMLLKPPAPQPIKIYNLISQANSIFWMKFESDYFILKRNITYSEQESEFHKATATEKTTWNVGGTDSGVTKEIISPREGRHSWTHTILRKSNYPAQGKLLGNGSYAEDICLLLSLVAGRGVYTDETIMRYSHKASIGESVDAREASKVLYDALNLIESATAEHSNFLGSVLSRYREAMQPMSHNNRLVRLFEILEMVSDYYCSDKNKPLPKGHTDYKTLREDIERELLEAEKRTGIPLREFTPILTQKSSSQKVRDCMQEVGLISALQLEGKEIKLSKAINLAHKFRSSITHSSNMDYEDHTWVQYYQFLEQTVFMVLLLSIGLHPEYTLAFLKKDLHGFLDNEDYYQKLSEMHEQKMKELDDFLAGKKKPDADGKTRFSM